MAGANAGRTDTLHHPPPVRHGTFAAADSELEIFGARLRQWFDDIGDVVVAFSGGVDSALLAFVAHDVLGQRAHAVTAVSPSLAGQEYDECARLAREWGLRWSSVTTDEMESAAYRVNNPDRCYHCKDALMRAMEPLSASATVVLGVNTDDLRDHRPGQAAAEEWGARFPFVECGINKAAIRGLSQGYGLSTWQKPAMACLASRIPHGTEVSVQLLSRIERAEAVVRAVVSGNVRVRDHGDVARIEVDAGSISSLIAHRDMILDGIRAVGYRYVAVDLHGFESGSLNPVSAMPS